MRRNEIKEENILDKRWHCNVCNKNYTVLGKSHHLRTEKHNMRVRLQEREKEKNREGYWFCDICRNSVHISDKENHLKSSFHDFFKNVRIEDYKRAKIMYADSDFYEFCDFLRDFQD